MSTLLFWIPPPALTSSPVVYLIYVDSYLFVFVTAILQFALGVNTSIKICDGAILLCLVCYVTTKASPSFFVCVEETALTWSRLYV